MKEDSILLIVAVGAVIVSLFAAGLTYFSISNLAEKITGYATAQVNLSVESTASINFTTNYISWGSGQVSQGSSAASLTTFGINNVSGGNWTLQQAGGLRIENVGNINVTLNLSGAKTAAQFISGTSPVYQWNITNLEPLSCVNNTGGLGGLNLDTFHNVNTSTVTVCPKFQPATSYDSIRIDFNLTIPSDSSTGALTDTITAIASA